MEWVVGVMEGGEINIFITYCVAFAKHSWKYLLNKTVMRLIYIKSFKKLFCLH